MSVGQLENWFSLREREIYSDFFRFLQFRSISMDSTCQAQMEACAKWLSAYLQEIGMRVELWPTSGHSLVFAEYTSEMAGAPTLLIYHHYDVQPADPLDSWDSDPFTPIVRDGAVYARGAQDNKGQCFYTITALKALLQLVKRLSFNIKLFIEGEEESGSHGTKAAIQAHRSSLQADHLLIVDANLASEGVPGLTFGFRGLLSLEVMCKNADVDLHSGLFGGIAFNPNRALAHALAALWDERGSVKIPHFYDEVAALSPKEHAQFHFNFDAQKMAAQFGMRAFAPEPGFSPLETAWLRPVIEINGMHGGYTGEGVKSVLPAQAYAKLSCRLVPNQDPDSIYVRLVEYLRAQFPTGFEVQIELCQGSAAFRTHLNSVIAKTAAKAYEEVMQVPCRYLLAGGSIPIISELAEASSAETVIMGFGLDQDNIHGPNEHFGLDRFKQGFLTMGRIFALLDQKH